MLIKGDGVDSEPKFIEFDDVAHPFFRGGEDWRVGVEERRFFDCGDDRRCCSDMIEEREGEEGDEGEHGEEGEPDEERSPQGF